MVGNSRTIHWTGAWSAPVVFVVAAVLLLFPSAMPNAGAVPAAQASAEPPALLGPQNGAEVDGVPEFIWNAEPGALGYKFQLATSASFTSRHYETVVSAPSVQLPQSKEPAANTTYYWRVATIQAEDGQTGEYSDAWMFLRRKPAGPTLVGPTPLDGEDYAVVNYPTPPVLEWVAVPGAKDYTLQYSTDASFVANVTTKTTASTSYALSALAVEGSTYYWRVRANLPSSVTTDYSTAGALKVTWPSTLRPTLLAPIDEVDRPWSQAHFEWTPVPGAARYQIQITPDNDFNDVKVDDTVVGTHYVPRETLADDTYYWRVRALSSDLTRPGPWSVGTGPEGLQRVTRVWLDHGLPTRPVVWAGLPDQRPSGEQAAWANPTTLPVDAVAFSWTPVPGASYYQVQISEHPSFMDLPAPNYADEVLSCKTPHTTLTASGSGTYKHTTTLGPCAFVPHTSAGSTTTKSGVWVAVGDTYYVRVRAVDATAGNGEINSLWSNDPRPDAVIPPTLAVQLTDNPLEPTPEGEPAVKQFPTDGSSWEDSPVLGWRPVANADHYRVALSVTAGFTSRETTEQHFTVKGTRFIPPQSLLDNDAGKPFYWYVLPCSTSCVPENLAIPTAWTFTKASHRPTGLVARPLRFLYDRSVPAGVGVGEPAPCTAPEVGGPVTPDPVTGVCLSWNDAWEVSAASSDNGTGPGTKVYRVQVSTDPNFATTSFDEITDATAIVPDVVLNDATYHWRVRIKDGGNWDGPWATGTPFTRPIPPRPELQTPSRGPLPTLSWGALPGAASYVVEIYAGTEINGDPVATAGTTSTAYAGHSPLTWLKRGTYTWRVRLKDGYGVVGPWSEAGEAFHVGVAPVKFQGPADHATVDVTSLVLAWEPITGVSGHRIDISTKEDFSSIVETADVTGGRWTPTKLTAPGKYYWRVRGLSSLSSDNVLSGPNDPIRSFTLRIKPGTPTGLSATAGVAAGIAQLSTTWTAPVVTGGASITGYRVRYRPTGTTQWATRETSGNTTGATLINLQRSTEYEVQVAAVNALGQSKYSASVERTTAGAPAAPRNVTATVGYGQAAVRWSAPSSNGDTITSYVLRYAASGVAQRTTVVTKPATGSLPTSVTLVGLVGGKTYTVAVTAKNGLGEGPAASVAVPTPLQPGKPQAVKVSRGDRALGITWQAPANATAAKVTGYTVEKRTLSGSTWSSWSSATSTLPATGRAAIVTGLKNGTSYQLRVTAKATYGLGIPSDSVAGIPAAKPGTPSVTLANLAHRLQIKWTKPSTNGTPLTGYQVQTSTNKVAWRTVAWPPASATTFTWSVPAKNVTYYVRVAARNAMGTGAWSTVKALKVT